MGRSPFVLALLGGDPRVLNGKASACAGCGFGSAENCGLVSKGLACPRGIGTELCGGCFRTFAKTALHDGVCRECMDYFDEPVSSVDRCPPRGY